MYLNLTKNIPYRQTAKLENAVQLYIYTLIQISLCKHFTFILLNNAILFRVLTSL